MAPPNHSKEMVLLFVYFILGTSAAQLVSSESVLFDGVISNKGKPTNVPENTFVDDQFVHILDQTHDHTTFDCMNMKPGYYADVQLNCRVFHYCKWDGTKSTFTCPKGFQFNQETETCDTLGIKCGDGDSAVTDIPPQETMTQIIDQIPATSPPTTTTGPTDDAISVKRVQRHAVWVQDPRPTQHQLAANNLFVPQHFVPSPVAAASSTSSSSINSNGNGPVFHLLIPSPQQQQQQPIFQVVSDVDPFLTLSTATQSQRHLGLANLVTAPTATHRNALSSMTTRQGQLSRSSRPVVIHSENPTEHFFNTERPLSPPPAVGFLPGRDEQFSPQFFIDDEQDSSDVPESVFSEAPRQDFVSQGQGSRRGNTFFPSARRPPPPFSDNSDFRQPFSSFLQEPQQRPRPAHHQNQQPQTNFIINPEDLTLINEIRFPGPPQDNQQTTTQQQHNTNGGSSADRRPTFQQRPHQTSSSPVSNSRRPSPLPSSQGFLSHDEHRSRFPQAQRFPAESPGNFNFAPSHRQHPLVPFQHPPPFFSQEFPPPTSFRDFPVQQTSWTGQTEPPNIPNGPRQQQTPNDGFTPLSEDNRPFIGNIPRGSPQPIPPPSPPPSAPTTERGQNRFGPQSNVFESSHNSRRQPNKVNIRTTQPPPKKPVFSSSLDSAPLTETTEEFGIPPPTESFGIKLGPEDNGDLVHSTSTPSKVRPPSRPVVSTQTSPPPQFFSAAPPSPFPTVQQPDRFFTPHPSVLQPNLHQRPSSNNHFRESSTPLSNDIHTRPNRPSQSSEGFRSSPDNEESNIRQNDDANQDFNSFFQPPQSSSEANFDNGGGRDSQQFRRPFHGQVEETSSIENLDDTDGQRGNLQDDRLHPTQNFAPFHHQRPGDDNRFSDFEGPFGANRGILAGPTFGPQSVDQLAPPDIPPFTTRPNTVSPIESTLGTTTNQHDNIKLTEATENESQSKQVGLKTTSTSESTTSDPVRSPPNGKRTRIPVGVTTSGRKGVRTRPPRVQSKATTSTKIASTTASHRRRGRPTTTTSPPETSSLVTSATTVRRRKPFLRRKTTTTTAAPTVSELNDITSSEDSVSTSSTNSRKRRPSVRRLNNENSTRSAVRRRRPFLTTRFTSTPSSSTATLRSSSSSLVEDAFPASVSHHSSGISRDQLVTSGEHGRNRNVNTKPKQDAMNDGSLEGLESKEQPIVTKTDGVEMASLESSVHEHSALATTSPTANSMEISSKLTSTRSTQKTTTTTAKPTTVVAMTENITTSTLTTEKPDTLEENKPEAMAKLRSLLSRKFIIKQTTEKPNPN